ncbi:hypothetical protein AOLI_G00204050 [Acnodon oligacanthus]
MVTQEVTLIKTRQGEDSETGKESDADTLFSHPNTLAFYPTIHHCVRDWATRRGDKSACHKYRMPVSVWILVPRSSESLWPVMLLIIVRCQMPRIEVRSNSGVKVRGWEK